MKLKGTPLQRARELVDAAMHDIQEAWDAWAEDEALACRPRRPPRSRDCELRLRPDAESTSYALLVEVEFDHEPVDPSAVILAIGGVLEKHGVATVAVLSSRAAIAGITYEDDAE